MIYMIIHFVGHHCDMGIRIYEWRLWMSKIRHEIFTIFFQIKMSWFCRIKLYESYQNNDICQRYFAMIVYNDKKSRFLSHFVFAIKSDLCMKNWKDVVSNARASTIHLVHRNGYSLHYITFLPRRSLSHGIYYVIVQGI